MLNQTTKDWDTWNKEAPLRKGRFDCALPARNQSDLSATEKEEENAQAKDAKYRRPGRGAGLCRLTACATFSKEFDMSHCDALKQ